LGGRGGRRHTAFKEKLIVSSENEEAFPDEVRPEVGIVFLVIE
jgi:hypothetical protein